MNFKYRKSQVLNEIKSSIPDNNNYVGQFSIQEHLAEKAGKHYDFRLIINSVAYSWASRYLLPKTTSQKMYIIRQPDHRAEYATWSGDIPKGEYGAGKVKLIFNTDVIIIKSNDHNIKFSIPDGEFEGVYSFIHKSGDSWIVVRNTALTHDWVGKKHYSSKVDNEMWLDPNIVASEKKDGASVVAKITSKKGIGVVSVRKSKNGNLIIKDNSIPHISFTKSPKEFDGMVIRGELYFEKQPFSVLSGILNSKPKNAVNAQLNLGEKIKLAPFDIIKLPGGKDASNLNYKDKLRILEQFAKSINNKYIEVPKYTFNNKKEFYNKIISKGGEGVVLRHIENDKFFKFKKEETFTLKIVDYTVGTGRFKNKGIGAFVVEDGKGRRVGRVGSGLTDKIRIDAFNNFNNFKGKLIKVKMMEPTKKSIRSPRFVGWDLEKTKPDILPF